MPCFQRASFFVISRQSYILLYGEASFIIAPVLERAHASMCTFQFSVAFLERIKGGKRPMSRVMIQQGEGWAPEDGAPIAILAGKAGINR